MGLLMDGLAKRTLLAVDVGMSALALKIARRIAPALQEAAEAVDDLTAATSDFHDFWHSVSEGDFAGAELGLRSGFANVRVEGSGRSTALMRAAENDDGAMIRLLLTESDPSIVDIDGRDALMRAAAAGAGRAVEMLARFCDPQLVDKNGDSALSLAAGSEAHALSGEDLSALQELLPRSNARSRNQDGLNPSEMATKKGKLLSAELIEAWRLMREERLLLSLEASEAKARGAAAMRR